MKLRALIQRFVRAYGLKQSILRHDCVHAMTGLGPALADELRVGVVERAAKYGTSVFSQTPLSSENFDHIEMTAISRRIKPWGLFTAEALEIEAATPRLDPREVNALTEIGLKLSDTLYEVIGGRYKEKLWEDFDFRDFNIVAEVHALKHQYESPAHKLAEMKLTRIFRENAAQAGLTAADIPPLGQPWHTMGASA